MKPLKALVVEDSEVDEELLLRQLAKADYDVQSMRVQTAADMRKAIAEGDWDIILSDYAMPGFTGLDALRVLKESGRDIPLIIISGTIGEDVAVEAMRVGVGDYLIKGNLTRLVPAIERELENAVSRRSQKKAEEALRRSEENLASAQRIAHIGSWETDLVNNQLFWSEEVYRIFGVSKDDFGETLESFINFIHPEDRQAVQACADAALSQNAPYNIEHRIVRPDGEIRIVCEIGEVTVDESGKPIRFIGTVQDVTERNAAETKLRLMKSAVDSIIEGIVISDAQKPDNPIIYINAAFEKLTGYTFDEIKGQNCRFLQGAETNPRTVDEIREAIRKETSFHGEILNYRKNGESFWNELSISPVFDHSDRLTNFVGVQQNISERKQAEITLKASEAKIRQLVDSSIIGIITTHLNGSIMEANDVFLKTVGYSQQELLAGKLRWDEMTPPEIIWQDEQAKNQLTEFGYSTPREKEYIRKDGSRVPVMVGGTLLKGTEDTVLAFVLDISEQKRAENALRESEIRLRTILETEPECVKILGFRGEVLEMNPAGLTMIEADSIEQVRGFEVVKMVAPGHRHAFSKTIKNVLAGNTEILEFEVIGLKGTRRWLETHAVPMRNQTGEITSLLGVTRDITDRKRIEGEKAQLTAQVQQQNERLNNIIDNITGVVWEAWGKPDEATQKIDFISDYVETMLGYTVEEWIATPNFWLSIIHPDDRERMMQVTAENFLKSQSFTEEFRWITKDGRTVWVETRSTVICDEEGQAIGYRGVNIDITERKKSEESIHFQAHLLNTVEQSVIATDLDGRITYWNQFAQELYGWTTAEAVGRNIVEITTPEISQVQAAEIMAQLNAGKSWSGEFVVRNKDGKTFPAYISNSPIYDDKETIIGIVGVSTDISERIDSEKILRESEARFRLLCEAAPLGVFLTDAQGSCLFSNLYLQEVAGISFDETLHDGLAKAIHPDDREQVVQDWAETMATGKEWRQQYRFLHRDGAVRWVSVRTAPIVSANGQIISHVGTIEDITARRLAEESLRQAEAKYRSLVESSPAIVYLNEPHPPYSTIYVSPNVKIFGYSPEDWYAAPGMWMNMVYEEDRERVFREFEFAARHNLETDFEYRIVARDGSIYWWQDKGRLITDEEGNKIGWQGVILDVTETKKLEEQLRQSQKLESVGRLAGGIAHDFNNMLTAINGYSELTLRSLEETNPLRQNIEEIKKAGERSALLTHQLLAFSRQQVLRPVVLNLNEVITDTINLLQRLIGEDVELITTLNPKTGRVNVDPGQLSQIIMNLAVNARDAMPHGGKLIIETANVFLKPGNAKQKIGILPGAYVMLSVCDTGQGIDDKIQQQIFEPFFTTKESGKGTGLGLATVYGIVKQSGGNIEFESKAGIGTTFRIYLPRVAEQPEAMEITDTSAEFLTGTETILLVEDEELVRKLSRQMLETCGYTVIEARDGLEALKIFDAGDCQPDLLMTDVIMPQMGGRELAEKLTERLADIKILFTSGYTDDAVIRHGVIETNTNFIQKPFTFDALSRKVRELLDAEDFKVNS